MNLLDIKHKSTRKCVTNLKIDIEKFSTIDELKEYIRKNKHKLYRDQHPEYFREYMRERYRLSKDGKVNKYKRKGNSASPTTVVSDVAEPVAV